MSEKTSKGDCFIIMPISTPKSAEGEYNGDGDHFKHVLDCLLVPAVEMAGFNPIPPIAEGSDIIQAEIIQNLAEADLVLCDMSVLNPNVFYELGIRTALNKPIALVADDRLKKLPFDTAMLNCVKYKGDLNHWEMKGQIELLAKHIEAVHEKAKGTNSMWKYFGITSQGEFNPGSGTLEDKVDILMREVQRIGNDSFKIKHPLGEKTENAKICLRVSEFRKRITVTEMRELLTIYGSNKQSFPEIANKFLMTRHPDILTAQEKLMLFDDLSELFSLF